MKVPATTNNITKAVIAFLNNRGHFAFRVNTAGVWDGIAFRRISKESRGCSDVIACMKFQIDPATIVHGYFMSFEIKNELTKDKESDDQIKFHEHVRESGGDVIVVKSYDQFVEWYNNSVFA